MPSKAAAHLVQPIVLAAGAGRRLGVPKALAETPFRATFLEQSLAAIHCVVSDAEIPIVVIGASADKVVARHARETVRWVENPEWAHNDMAASLCLGIIAASADADAVLVWPVDLVIEEPDELRPLFLQGLENSDALVPHYRGRPGHPVLLSRGAASIFVDEVTNRRSPSPTLRTFLSQRVVLPVELASPSIMNNINRPSDLSEIYFESD